MLEEVCSVLHVMAVRGSQFQLWRIPQRFQECMNTLKRPGKQRPPLDEDSVRRYASALVCSVQDCAAFARSARGWSDFIQDVNALHTVLLL